METLTADAKNFNVRTGSAGGGDGACIGGGRSRGV